MNHGEAERSIWRKIGGCAQFLLSCAAFVAAPGCMTPLPPAGGEARALGALDGGPEDDGRLLVSVNGEMITEGDFYRRVVDKLGRMRSLWVVIEDELVAQEAERMGTGVSEEAVDRAASRFLEGMARESGGLERLTAEYEARGISIQELKRDWAPAMRAELLRREVVKAKRVIDEETLRKYYERTYKKKRYATRHVAYSFMLQPGQTEADQGRLKYQSLEKARRAVDRVRNGHDFDKIAKYESDDEITARLGGSLGAISEDSPLPAEFKEAIFALREGEVSEPIENPRAPGFHVFQVTKILPSESFVDCVDKMKRELREQEPTPEEVKDVLESLIRNAVIRWPGSGA